MRKWIGVSAAAAAIVLLAALPAGAGKGGTAPLHVRKVVVGPVPAGTQFVETIACDNDAISRGGNQPVSSVQLVFDAQGNPVGTGDTVTFVNEAACTVTETQTGGAASVIYECEGTVPPPTDNAVGAGRFSVRLGPGVPPPVCESNGPQSDPITVNIFTEAQEATVTVTNTFVTSPPSEPAPSEPAPAAAVVGAPSFTG